MKICVYAICKNESKFVKKWLDSMQEADYIVVLDTGSTDGTYKMLKEDSRVTRVEREVIKPWRFDVARNKSLELVPEDTDLCVCTDLDEVFEAGWADVIRANYRPDTDRMFYTYAWSHNNAGEPTNVFRYDKIHTRNHYKWIYPVHEILMPDFSDRPQRTIDLGQLVWLHHFPDNSKDRNYYFDLLELSCKENPTDCHVQMLYAREWLIKYDKTKDVTCRDRSLEEYLKCLDMPEISQPYRKEVLLHCLLSVACIFEDIGEYDKVVWYCQEFIKEDYTYRDPYLLIAEVYNRLGEKTGTKGFFILAESYVKTAEEYTQRHYSWVERENTFTGWLEDIMAVAQCKIGKFESASRYAEVAVSHNPTDVRLLRNENAILKELLRIRGENNA